MSDITTALALRTPELEPVPVDGCSFCAAAVRQREAAHRLGRVASVRSANEAIRQHPHRRAADVREGVA